MNSLTSERQAAVIRALVEGNSLRATARLTGVARNTVSNLLRDLGSHCKNHHDRFVRDVSPKRVQMDEVWSFAKKKEGRVKLEERGTGVGDCWTWVAIDQDSKLVISYRVGSRDSRTGYAFVQDLADRLASRCQLTSDGLPIYVRAVEKAFGWNGADFAQIVKIFGSDSGPEAGRRYSPAVCIGTEKHWIMGKPDMAYVSTSHAERQNLTMRMQMRRFTRLTNAFSKKVEYHLYAVSLHYMHYNYCRVHTMLSKQYGVPTTPAMAAGLTDHVWSIHELLELLQGN